MKVRTTQQPDVEIEVDDGEYAQLKTMGLLVEEDTELADTLPKDSYSVRTTQQPDVEILVDEAELAQLESMGIIVKKDQEVVTVTEEAMDDITAKADMTVADMPETEGE